MGLFDWFSIKHFDEQDDGDDYTEDTEDTEEEDDASTYEQGQAYARAAVDERRHNWQEHGYSSFQESVQIGGEIWHRIVQQEETNVKRGWTARQGQLEYAKGALSQYD